VVLRNVWLGQVRHAIPARVVVDRDDLLGWWIAPGTRFQAPTGTRGDMARADMRPGQGFEEQEWYGGGALFFTRRGDLYCIGPIWDEDGELTCWYVNLQQPLRPTPIGFDTMDLILDVVIAPDLSRWAWRDEDKLDEAVRRSVLSPAAAAHLRAAGRHAAEQALAHRPIDYRPWADWRPPGDWGPPALPEGWEAPATR
jgi:hypothetical protein